MRKCRTFVGKPFQDIKLLILTIWLLNSEALEQILKRRKKLGIYPGNFTAERFKARKVGVLPDMSIFAENINTILCNF